MTQPSAGEVLIREFQPGDEAAFRDLNEEWITRYFRIEAKDQEAFADPQEKILKAGGRIFFAILNSQCVGCCALIRIGKDEDEYEVAKMAVTSKVQGAGIGRKVLHATIEAARASGARRLYLETNHALEPAIRLYESAGFKHLPPEKIKPSVYDRADVFMEKLLR